MPRHSATARESHRIEPEFGDPTACLDMDVGGLDPVARVEEEPKSPDAKNCRHRADIPAGAGRLRHGYEKNTDQANWSGPRSPITACMRLPTAGGSAAARQRRPPQPRVGWLDGAYAHGP